MSLLLLATLALGSEQGAPPETIARAAEPEPSDPEVGWSGFALWQARGTLSTVGTSNPLVDGQVIGELGGSNGTVVLEDARSAFVEQRLNLFASYAPPLLDGRAELGGALEVDFGWGDQSYAVAGNTGGAFGADQVNLQTRRLYATIEPDVGASAQLRITGGLQLLSDSVNDPTRSTPDELLRSGGRFMVLGSEAAGLAAYGRHQGPSGDLLRWRLGGFTLYEQATGDADDVWVLVADAELRPAWRTTAGLHAWSLFDRSGGSAGLLGVGPSSALSEMQGGPRLDLRAPGATEAPAVYTDITWLGLDLGYDAGLSGGPLGLHGVAITNLGRMVAGEDRVVPIAGALAMGEARLRYPGGTVQLQGIYTTRDDPTDDSSYDGILTANSYGIAGAMYATHGGYLLFPDPGAINRQTAAVYDISGGGEGLVGGGAELAYEPIPHRLSVAAGLLHARNTSGQGVGSELHGRIVGEPLTLLELGLHAGYLFAGERSAAEADAWTMILHTQWLVL